MAQIAPGEARFRATIYSRILCLVAPNLSVQLRQLFFPGGGGSQGQRRLS